jgi:hypothetical protein
MASHGVAGAGKFTLLAGDPEAGRKVFIEAACHKRQDVKGETFPAVADADKEVGSGLSQMACIQLSFCRIDYRSQCRY